MSKIILSAVLTLYILSMQFTSFAQEKKVLSHNNYDQWNDLVKGQVSPSGNFVMYGIYPQDGDGTLWLYNTETKNYHHFIRGLNAAFSPGEDFIRATMRCCKRQNGYAVKKNQ